MIVSINGVDIGKDCPPYIIAELSANHNGSLDRAIESINEAHRCGAHAIKLQTYSADTMTIDCDHSNWLVSIGFCQLYILKQMSTGQVFGPAGVDKCIVYLNDAVIRIYD